MREPDVRERDRFASVLKMEEQCPDCGGEEIGCPFGDWSWGDDDIAGDHG
jgi:hypothetical protein